MSKRLTREELYAAVWTTPIYRLSKEYNFSDRGLAKICQRMEIPVPPRGYWAKLANGKSVKQAPLPALKEKYENFVDITPAPKRPATEKIEITVPDQLTSPHPLVAKTKTRLGSLSGRADQILATKHPVLGVRVTKDSLSRALRLMDSVIKGLEAHNCSVRIDESMRPATTKVVVEGYTAEFSLEERLSQELIETNEWGSNTYKYHPTGQLSLKLRTSPTFQQRSIWSDGKRQRVEHCIGDFVSVVKAWGPLKEAWELEKEERNRRNEQRRQTRIAENEKKRQAEGELASWLHAEKLRSYATRLSKSDSLDDELKAWVNWIKRYADTLDPCLARQEGQQPRIESRFQALGREFPTW